jgi:hypothetical protein
MTRTALRLLAGVLTHRCFKRSTPLTLNTANETIVQCEAYIVRRASSLSGNLNINKERPSVFTPEHGPSGINSTL